MADFFLQQTDSQLQRLINLIASRQSHLVPGNNIRITDLSDESARIDVDMPSEGQFDNINVRGTTTTRDLVVTGVAHFFKLVIDEIKSIGGQIIVTAANASIDHVEEISGGWRCYFRSEEGGREVDNQFAVGDMAVCRTFNAATGVSYNTSNKYYWRKVIGVCR